jgi:Recombination endonuclease VII
MANVNLTKMSSEERERRAVKAHWRTKGISYTIDEYNESLERQDYCCAICHRHKDSFKYRLSVDHDHYTNEVRGLLCRRCNLLLGFCGDSIGILESTIKYLAPHVYLDYKELDEALDEESTSDI